MTPRPAPTSEAELLERAKSLAGLPLATLAEQQALVMPKDLSRHKGFVGQLLERALGATAGSRPIPDFEQLGVELKTIPLDRMGRPKESTFVCAAPLPTIAEVEWKQSPVRCKLRRVLWVPIEAERELALADRRVGAAVLWTLTGTDEQDLQHDWEELAGQLAIGGPEGLTAHIGRYLQVRPKARNAKVQRSSVDADGAPVRTSPRGFYLRSRFTERIFSRYTTTR